MMCIVSDLIFGIEKYIKVKKQAETIIKGDIKRIEVHRIEV